MKTAKFVHVCFFKARFNTFISMVTVYRVSFGGEGEFALHWKVFVPFGIFNICDPLCEKGPLHTKIDFEKIMYSRG